MFCDFGSEITAGDQVAEEVSVRMEKVGLGFCGVMYLWRRRAVRMHVQSRVYAGAVRTVLLYESETWALGAEEVRRLSVFDRRCIRRIGCIWWEH